MNLIIELILIISGCAIGSVIGELLNRLIDNFINKNKPTS
jgi:uncharacterized membrane protein